MPWGEASGRLDDEVNRQLQAENDLWKGGYEVLHARQDLTLERIRQALRLLRASDLSPAAVRLHMGRLERLLTDVAEATPKIATPQELRLQVLAGRSQVR